MIDKTEVIKLSAAGLTPKEIAEKTGIDYKTIYSWRDKIKLNFQGSGGLNRLINSNPFEKWDEEAQYWFGYIVGDGCLSSKKYSISIGSKDIEHLTKYQNWLGLKTMHISVNKVGSTIGTVLFGHRETHAWLIERGITPKKSLTVSLSIPFTSHILRGLFDADGCARKARNRSKITSGSMELLQQVQIYLLINGINSTVAVQHKRTYCISISGYNDRDFYKLLYGSATVYLERKEEKLRRATMRK